ncbi:MAG: hypothetical protein QOF91_590 [Alphaproteobacteria bacterium]|nr:hypothetical protein [Alphaproteobacteria bacterium]
MKTVFFLLLRLICYLALAMVVAASLSLIIASVNGQCPRIDSGMGVTCATRFSQWLADFGLAVLGYTLDMGYPIALVAGGLIFLLRDVRRKRG